MRFATLATLLAGAALFVLSESNARATMMTLTQTLTTDQGIPLNGTMDLFTWTITWSGLGTPSEAAHLQVGSPGLPGSIHIDLSGADAIDRLADLFQTLDQTGLDLHPKIDPPGGIGGQLATPEPSTTLLLGAGLAFVVLALARRRHRA
jgi:hypothetical protein